jgi:hypothetical protein
MEARLRLRRRKEERSENLVPSLLRGAKAKSVTRYGVTRILNQTLTRAHLSMWDLVTEWQEYNKIASACPWQSSPSSVVSQSPLRAYRTDLLTRDPYTLLCNWQIMS